MEKVESQENTIETAIEINSFSETKSDHPSRSHDWKKTDRIIVSQYDDISYVITYSEEDNLILGWCVNVKEIGEQQPDLYFKLDKPSSLFVLYKKMLLCYIDDGDDYKYRKYLFRYDTI
jgi:hypothetical protein